MSKIISVKGKEEFQKVIAENKGVIVDFYADWCGPCKKLGEIFKAKIGSGNGWVVAKIDVDEEENGVLAEEAGVSGIPQVDLYIGGKQTEKFVGFNENKLNSFIDKAAEQYQ
ncbi:Thioredoxin-like fold [Pseudocohnilembus persalinus]|uniref:Thioredoxin n=1 Tax=Pseudocohnilembus persalinus TaxID=266149 RepID=A0A0V0QP56_PSEPJ|nr:Thioredoxin-like fold [Pseudocohnilembus persalinus]|eukprot:KRX03933.1 Thioredoxin-like fold [Pseudocohnilembus persalinus]